MNNDVTLQNTLIKYRDGEYYIVEGAYRLPPDVYERYMRNTEEYLKTLGNR